MKKIILIVCLLTLVKLGYSQIDCGCGTPIHKESIKGFCPYTFQYPGDPTRYLVDPGFTLKITWDERNCNGKIYITIKTVTFISAAWNHYNDYLQNQLTFPSGNPFFTCPDVNGIPTDNDDRVAMRDFLNRMVRDHGPQGNYNNPEILIEGGCSELVRIVWPAGAGFWQPAGDNPGGGPPPPNKWVPLTDSWELVKCTGSTCCKFVNSSNGQSTSTTTTGSECDNSTRNPSWTPTMGGFTGTVVWGSGCKPSCGNSSGSGSFTSGLDKKSQPIALTSNPTLVTDKIFFNTKEIIKQAVVYDIKGKKVMEQPLNEPELNLQGLKSGVYFIQLQFENKEVHSIKIYKD